jgi:hypothetical protein
MPSCNVYRNLVGAYASCNVKYSLAGLLFRQIGGKIKLKCPSTSQNWAKKEEVLPLKNRRQKHAYGLP